MDSSAAPKSEYGNKVEAVLEKLNAVSPSFCLAKWYNLSLHLTNGQTHSCYHPPSHKIPIEGLQENPQRLHNTAFKKEQRALMLRGERPAECQYCWNIEDSDGGGVHLSDRAYRSADFF